MKHIHSAIVNKPQKFVKHSRDWWGYIWQGLLYEETAKHYKAMGRAVWLYLYLIVYADRKTGILYRKTATIARDTGIGVRTIQYWLTKLRKGDYIITSSTGRALMITITKWRPIKSSKSIK